VRPDPDALAAEILARASGARRFVVAIAGPPGAGKSTLAEGLHGALSAARPGGVALVPMDGFHFDNAVLDARGLRAVKGAPETFDFGGLRSALQRIRDGDDPVAVPVFDRAADLARAGAQIVDPSHGLVIVEGNYLLLDDVPWPELAPLFDLTVAISVDPGELHRRLVDRWLTHGLSPEAARVRAESNDMANGRRVAERSRAADIECAL